MLLSELLSDESKWTKGVTARDKDGNICNSKDPNAVCWCLFGAVWKADNADSADKAIRRVIPDEFGGSIVMWNDAPERTFADIKALIVKLGI